MSELTTEMLVNILKKSAKYYRDERFIDDAIHLEAAAERIEKLEADNAALRDIIKEVELRYYCW